MLVGSLALVRVERGHSFSMRVTSLESAFDQTVLSNLCVVA